MADNEGFVTLNEKQAKTVAQRLAGWFSKRGNTLEIRPQGMTADSLRSFALKTNLKIAKNKEGEYVSIPTSFFGDPNKLISFYDNWLNTFTRSSVVEANRLSSYQIYDIMDENMVEAAITLDSYADEAVSLGFVDNPIRVTVNNEKAEKELIEVLERNDILKRARSDIRCMCKYGDACYTFNYKPREENQDSQIKDEMARDPLKDLIIAPLNPKYFTIVPDTNKKVIKYRVDIDQEQFQYMNISQTSRVKEYDPWNFVDMSIKDDITFPYGKSILYSMRSLFDQLATLEALLALSRASKVQRLVIKLPVATNDSAEAFARISDAKANYKSTIFSDAAGTKSGRKIAGLTEILWIPKDLVDIDTIESKIDISSTEDVEHFLEKALRGTRLPKGYLYGDEVTDRGGALAEQDLKFARVLIPIQDAYVDGLEYMCLCILAHLGYDVTKVVPTVTLERPSNLSADLIARYSDILQMVEQMTSLWRENVGDPVIDADGQPAEPRFPERNLFQLLVILGIPVDISKLITSKDTVQVISKDKLDYYERKPKIKGAKQIDLNDLIGDMNTVYRVTATQSSLNSAMRESLQENVKNARSNKKMPERTING